MWQIIQVAFPQTIAVAVSPIPLVALIVLASGRRSSALSFALGWLLAAFVGIGAVTLLGRAATSSGHAPSTGRALFNLAVGLLFLALAWRSWSTRPRTDDPPTPTWLASVGGWSNLTCLGAGTAVIVLNAKNLPIMATLGASIGTAHLSTVQAVVTAAVLAVLCAGSALVVVGLLYLGGEGGERRLAALRGLLIRWNNVILAVLFGYMGLQTVLNALAILFG